MSGTATRSRVPEARHKPDQLRFKTAEDTSGQLLALDEAEGIVTAIVSVTGTEDEVADIIVPGAYRETLVRRNPKVCWAHSWEHPIGRTLHAEEMMPGDPRLPKHTKDGQPWPAEAGALVATMQFNLRTREGKDAFEAVLFYSQTGECEYSIGYQVPAGKSSRRNGIRYIKALDLYELSVVLFGAHTMTGTLSIKAFATRAREAKAAQRRGTGRGAGAAALAALRGQTKAAPPFTKKDEKPVQGAPGAEPPADGKPAAKIKPGVTERDDLPQHDADTNLTTEDCPCGDLLVFDTGNGWQRLDGSYSHEDGSTHSDHIEPPEDTNAAPNEDPADPAAEPGADPAAPGAPAAGDPAAPAPGTADPNAAKPDGLPDFTDGVMVALYPDPAAADAIANHIAGPDQTVPREELHVTLAYLGKVSTSPLNSDEMVQRLTDALEGEAGLRGTVGGIGAFPASDEDNGAPTWVPVDVPGLSLLRENIVNALGNDNVSNDHGFTPHMTIGWDLGIIEPIPSTPVKFTEIRVVYGDLVRSIPLGGVPEGDEDDELEAKGMKMLDLSGLSTSEVGSLTAAFARWDALNVRGEAKAEGGADRNRGGAEDLRHYWTTGEGGTKIGWGTSGDFTRCVALLEEHMPGRAEGYCANRHKEMTGMWPGDKDNKHAYDPSLDGEHKVGGAGFYPVEPGDVKGYPRLAGSREEAADLIGAAVNEALRGDETDNGFEWDHVSVDGTYDGHLYATRMRFDTDERETFEMVYRLVDGGVELGEPEPVALEVVPVYADGQEADADVTDLLPIADDLMTLTSLFKAAQGRMEGKAGRVLSGKNERALRESVERLVAVLAQAGVKIGLVEVEDDDDDPTKPPGTGDDRTPVDPRIDTETTSPSATTKSHPALGGEMGAEGVDLAEVEATLARLREGLD